MKEYTKKEIQKTLSDVYNIIVQEPDMYTTFIETAGIAWTRFKKGYDIKNAGLRCILWKLVKPHKAKEIRWINLDMFPELEEELKNISNNL
jgi:hypothetical protein